MSAAGDGLRIVLYEGVGAQPLSAGARGELLSELLSRGHPVAVVRAATPLRPGAATDGMPAILVLGRIAALGTTEAVDEGSRARVFLRDVEGLAPPEILALVDGVRAELRQPAPGGWKPWFPVIDYDRCTNCMQCLSFCLFDVYGVSPEKKIRVQQPRNCKTDCPACSRVCPEVAILFPKYRHGPINGDAVNAEDVRREAMKIDISALLGGDIYAALRDRSARAKSRFSKERDDERALKERQRCLTKLQQPLEIPAEVLRSLPSADEIRAKVARAEATARLPAPGPREEE